MKKTISLILALLLSLSLMVFSAGAAGGAPFTDTGDLDAYTLDNIDYLYQQGVMNGTDDTSFSPYDMYTRAMFVTMLGRTEGIDPSDYPGSHFTDVSPSFWGAPYINWAAENGIVNGVGDRKFNPGGIITLEQYCTIVCRYMDRIDASFNYRFFGDWPPLIYDIDEAGTYAWDSLQTMVNNDLTYFEWNDGDTAGVYACPKMEMNRADIALYFGDFHYLLKSGNPLTNNIGHAEITSWIEFG